jgi:endonuclease/exonuclease/phosphatase family metal-dependent hydrolase
MGLMLLGGNGCKKSIADLRVMTFNIRYDNPEDSVNNWRFRKSFVAEVIHNSGIDILGAQEVLSNQLRDILEECPEYDYVGVGRLDGETKGEYSPVFFLKSRFLLERSGYFWLSEHPDEVGSVGWDAACERIVSWAVFKIKESGKKVAFFNTHFDHVGKIARKESAILLAKNISEIAGKLPVVVTGDFNVPAGSEAIKTLQTEGNLFNAKQIASSTSGPAWSFHDFGKIPEPDRTLIDHILVSENITIKTYENLFLTKGQLFMSDHNPIVVSVKF